MSSGSRRCATSWRGAGFRSRPCGQPATTTSKSTTINAIFNTIITNTNTDTAIKINTNADLRPLVSVIAHDKAEEEPGHDNVAEAEHGEVPGGVGGGEDELA